MSFCTESYVLKRRIFKAVLLVIIAAAFAPFVIAARYAVFQPSDDFSFYLGVMRMPGENYIVKAIRFALELYPLWQGTYTTNLLNCLLNPLSVYSYAMLRLELIMCLLLSCLAVYLLCREITACFSLGDKTLPIWIFEHLFRGERVPIVNVVAIFSVILSIIPVYIAHRLTREEGPTSRGGGAVAAEATAVP